MRVVCVCACGVRVCGCACVRACVRACACVCPLPARVTRDCSAAASEIIAGKTTPVLRYFCLLSGGLDLCSCPRFL